MTFSIWFPKIGLFDFFKAFDYINNIMYANIIVRKLTHKVWCHQYKSTVCFIPLIWFDNWKIWSVTRLFSLENSQHSVWIEPSKNVWKYFWSNLKTLKSWLKWIFFSLLPYWTFSLKTPKLAFSIDCTALEMHWPPILDSIGGGSMVLKLDGSLGHVAHVWKEIILLEATVTWKHNRMV